MNLWEYKKHFGDNELLQVDNTFFSVCIPFFPSYNTTIYSLKNDSFS